MKNPLKIAGAALLGAAALFAGTSAATATSGSATFYYYVEFYLGSTQVGYGQVGCFDEPIEYMLLWGSDQGEMVVVGRENCSPFPPIPGS